MSAYKATREHVSVGDCLSRERRCVDRQAPRFCGLLEGITEREQARLGESGAEKRQRDRKTVPGEACGHDEIRKAREVRESRRGPNASASTRATIDIRS